MSPAPRRGEAQLFTAGLFLWGMVAAEITLAWLFDATAALRLTQGLAAEVFLGREVGIPIALSGGAPNWAVAVVSLSQDLAAVAVAYPVFLWLLHRYHQRDNLFMRRLRRVEAAAHRHRAYVHRWGPLGVFVFMLVPFLVNGPLIGAILGRLAGIDTRYLIVPVTAATAVAAFAWTYAFDTLLGLAHTVDPRVPPILTGAILGLVVGGMILSELREARRGKRGP